MSDNGFFFGSAPAPGAPLSDNDEPEVVEVSGEPVSRNEAKTLGVFDLDSQPSLIERGGKTTRVKKMAPTGKHTAIIVPEGVSTETVRKVEEARDLLAEGEIEQALTLAQEAVWEQPSFVSAKVVIARAFIAKNEDSKALALLQAIPDVDMTPDALYFLGIALNNLGRGPQALESFKKALARAGADADLRKRITDMISRMQGEYVTCPMCGRKVLPDSIVDIGEESVCIDCARELEEEASDDDYEIGDGGTRRRKRLRPPLSKTDVVLRVALGLLALFLILFGIYYLLPDTYAKFRAVFPASWTFLPKGGTTPPPPVAHTGPVDNTPKIVPSFVITSDPMKNPMVGAPYSHQLKSIGMGSPNYRFEISPPPKSAPKFDTGAGLFTWTPSSEDEGETFRVVFQGMRGASLSIEQENSVTVLSAPKVREIGASVSSQPGDACHLLTADVDGDGKAELVAASGDYWTGRIVVFGFAADGSLWERWRADFSGRPVGIGVVSARGETWLAIADYWTSRIRFFAARNDALSEVALSINLPGRPILAAVDPNSSTIAALCLTASGYQVAAYRQVDQLTSDHIGSWPIPDGSMWQKLHILKPKPAQRSNPKPGAEPDPVRFALVRGGARPLYYLDSAKSSTWRESGTTVGVVLDSVIGGNGDSVTLVTVGPDRKTIAVHIDPESSLERRQELDGVPAHTPGEAALFDANGDGAHDLTIITRNDIGVYFGKDSESDSPPLTVSTASPAMLPGSWAVSAVKTQNAGERLFFLGGNGMIQSLSLAD